MRYQEEILDYAKISSVNMKYREEDSVHGLFVIRSVILVDGCSTREDHQTDNYFHCKRLANFQGWVITFMEGMYCWWMCKH